MAYYFQETQHLINLLFYQRFPLIGVYQKIIAG
jgi:hypothetical protein